MTRRLLTVFSLSQLAPVGPILATALVSGAAAAAAQEIPPAAKPGWVAYIADTEQQRIDEVEPGAPFLTLDITDVEAIRRCRDVVYAGEVCTASLQDKRQSRPAVEVDDALLHHWYAAALVPATTLADVLDFVRAYELYPQHFDEVNTVEVLERGPESLRARLWITRKKVLTVHYNLDQDAVFTRHSDTRASARIVTTRIRELDDVGRPDEREKPFGDDRGFLWALNAYWRYEEVDEGVILEAEVVSLSRKVPWALRWLVGPFVDSVPRESLEATLEGIRSGVADR